jgi:phage terminase large subunit GpA-like protein
MESYDGGDAVEPAWRDGLTPDPLLTVSEWADRYRVLSQRASSEPGRWRTERTPYLKEIIDCLSPASPFQRVVFMKGAQVGRYRSGNCWIGYVIHQAPGPMMAVAPTVGRAGQAQLQAAAGPADRGERGPARTGQGAPEPGQRQYGAE